VFDQQTSAFGPTLPSHVMQQRDMMPAHSVRVHTVFEEELG
jgi:hypothetical protein